MQGDTGTGTAPTPRGKCRLEKPPRLRGCCPPTRATPGWTGSSGPLPPRRLRAGGTRGRRPDCEYILLVCGVKYEQPLSILVAWFVWRFALLQGKAGVRMEEAGVWVEVFCLGSGWSWSETKDCRQTASQIVCIYPLLVWFCHFHTRPRCFMPPFHLCCAVSISPLFNRRLSFPTPTLRAFFPSHPPPTPDRCGKLSANRPALWSFEVT